MKRFNRWLYGFVILAFAGYSAWILGPYVRSTIVRDAAVTTWAQRAVAPIAGRIAAPLPAVDSAIPDSGIVTTIRNDLLLDETRKVEATRDEVLRSEADLDSATAYLAELEALERQRVKARDRLVQVFEAQLDTDIETIQHELEHHAEQLEVLQRIADRQQQLLDRGSTSDAALDEMLLRLAEARATKGELEARLASAKLRRQAADDGVAIMASGESPDWVRRGEIDLHLELPRARDRIARAKADLAEARKDLAAEEAALERLRQADVTAPAGSIVYSVVAFPGATVSAGATIIEWIDCDVLLLDVPVSDSVLPLIRRGAAADVLLEGESAIRPGTVLLTRGSGATLARVDLAAVSKGRGAGVAQVIVALDPAAGSAPDDECPVGRAAYVTFPGVGFVDVIRARLRL